MKIKFTERQKKSLETMAEKLGTSQGGVLKAALSLLKVAIKERKSNHQIAVVRNGVVIKEIIGIM